ncbi:MAG: excinuclease ABC subunit UvrB [Tidjanibacter sp.]|nr:excinuclease ABC subunit UvrB [Tidjanibacter sp.]
MSSGFKLVSEYQPTGDQPEAIEGLVRSVENGMAATTLLGVTGSGKTFTVANAVARLGRPTLVLSHNKTLAAQLYSEFKAFFPDNAVEYFVSYYDYYQPEAYLPASDTYIEKDLAINEDIEKLRLRTTASLLSGRRDVIVVSSVSCLYGIGNPEDFRSNSILIKCGERIGHKRLIYSLVDSLYTRTEQELTTASFRVVGDTIDIMPSYADVAYRIMMFGDEVEAIFRIDPTTGERVEEMESVKIFPANLFVTTRDRTNKAIEQIQLDLGDRITYYEEQGRRVEAQRIKQRVEYDLEMIKELGYCSGIENYSRYLDGRKPGERPFCLLDYFPEDYLLVIDESHVTIPQIRAMYGGDRARKETLVEYGFRLPAAIDNRPLTFAEFEQFARQTIYVSATPADYELEQCEGAIVEQLIRPTGLLDPKIVVRKVDNPIDDMLEEVDKRVRANERVLVTTLTKRMAEELSKYFDRIGVRNRYIHSDIDTFERVQILDDLRAGSFDVLVGVNLLREGLDLPEVSLVVILDADKEGFLRSERALTQTAGRAARNVNGMVIMYADRMTEAMRATIAESDRRREKQMRYNEEHGITPRAVTHSVRSLLTEESLATMPATPQPLYTPTPLNTSVGIAADVSGTYSAGGVEQEIENARRNMEEAAKRLDFGEAARWRDAMYALQERAAKVKK